MLRHTPTSMYRCSPPEYRPLETILSRGSELRTHDVPHRGGQGLHSGESDVQRFDGLLADGVLSGVCQGERTPPQKEYGKAYNRLKARKQRGKISEGEWNATVAKAQELVARSERGELTDEDLKRLLAEL